MVDYSKLGLKVGIEVHQQMEGKKLFCSCPTLIRDEDPDFTVNRKLRAMPGESGLVDVAALAEQMKGLSFVYEGYKDSTCLVELDESPPEPLNKDALATSLQVALMLKSKPVEQMRVMRKTVIDGSNTSGFQRTALLATGGEIETKNGKVGIQNVCIEEDAARIIREEPVHRHIVYRLDRLGIPLIEVGTAADIKTPEQAMETAEKIGLLMRSTGKAKRGLGTIRQDVNVSIKEGERIEIKGCQDLKLLPKLVENEVSRQIGLLEIKKEIEKRGIKKEQIEKTRVVDVTKLLADADSKILKATIANKGVVLAIKLPGFAGLIGKELQPNKRFGIELSDRAKMAARIGGIVHSDELPAYGLNEFDKEKIAKALGCRAEDAFVFVAEKKSKVEIAIEAIIARVLEAFVGIPREVRNPNEDGTSSYLRPMPGAARMYPETDIPAIAITKEMIAKIKIPELIEHKAARYAKLGLAEDLADLLARSNKTETFDSFVSKFKKLKPAYIAELIMTSAKTVKKQFNAEINPADADFEQILSALEQEKISKESVLKILSEGKPIKDVLGKFKLMSDEELEEQIKEIVKLNKDVKFNALIGIAMAELRGKAAGEKIVGILKKLAKLTE
jgi:glutamyl-tRNA(Gln) amidotransferase subunit E